MSRRLELELAGAVLEVKVGPAAGIRVSTGGTWTGYYVRYRVRRSRRWLGFTLVDHDHEPTEAELLAAIGFAESRRLGVPLEELELGEAQS